MVDASYWAHNAQMARLTREDLREFASRAVTGLSASALASSDSNTSSLLNRFINQEQEAWRRDFPGVRGLGERVSEETWTVGNTRHELPADFADLHASANGRITLLDTSGDEDDQLEVISVGDYENRWDSGFNAYTDRATPVAYLFGVSTNGKRFLEIYPTPTTAIQFRIRYVGFLENLDNDADELEAPLGMHEGIQWGVAARLGLYKGHARADDFQRKADGVRKAFQTPWTDERKRPGRVLTFEEVGGYKAFDRPE